ncbi:MAG: preprotein translocase subunit SecG [Candidatus Absconditabacterales bacterium]
MRTVLIILMILAGLILIGSVLLMSPKGGLGLGIGGMSGGGEYGSKKSLEGKLKNFAIVSSIIFVLLCVALPYVSRG